MTATDAPGPLCRPASLAHAAIGVAAIVLLAGCADVPELDAQIPDAYLTAPYPDLVPLDLALVALPPPQQAAERLETSLQGRREALRARARALQTPVIDQATRDRMAAGVRR